MAGSFAPRNQTEPTAREKLRAMTRAHGQNWSHLQMAYATAKMLMVERPALAATYQQEIDVMDLTSADKSAVDAVLASEGGA